MVASDLGAFISLCESQQMSSEDIAEPQAALAAFTNGSSYYQKWKSHRVPFYLFLLGGVELTAPSEKKVEVNHMISWGCNDFLIITQLDGLWLELSQESLTLVVVEAKTGKARKEKGFVKKAKQLHAGFPHSPEWKLDSNTNCSWAWASISSTQRPIGVYPNE